MNTQDPVEVRQAILSLEAVRSIPRIVSILRSSSEFRDIERSTVHRWLNEEPKKPRHRDAQLRIVRAAEIVQASLAAPLEINFATIRGATEMLPILLLDEPGIMVDPTVKITLHYKDTVQDCFRAVEDKQADLIIAPRRDGPVDAKARRLCRLVEVPVSGIFPGRHFTAEGLQKFLYENEAKNFRIGCLPNAEYNTVLRHFVSAYNRNAWPSTEVVSGYYDAMDKLLSGKIRGMVGHSVFISNCAYAIQRLQRSGNKSDRKTVEDLQQAPLGSFSPIKMDLFVRNEINPRIARKVLGVLHDVLRRINNGQNSPTLAKNIDKLLGLEMPTTRLAQKLPRPAQSGEDIIQGYKYEMKTFDTDTLLDLWQ